MKGIAAGVLPLSYGPRYSYSYRNNDGDINDLNDALCYKRCILASSLFYVQQAWVVPLLQMLSLSCVY